MNQTTGRNISPSSCSFCLCGLLLFALGLVTAAAGCGSRGQPSGRPDIDAIPEAEIRGQATKVALYEFRAKVKKRGVNAAKQELPSLIEGLEGYDKLPSLAEHQETYRQILEKLKSLQSSVAGSASRDAVVKAADEIAALADKLPGKADPNPQVE